MFTRTRLVLQVGRAKPVYHAFTYPSRFFTTTQVQAVAAHSLDSATVNQTTQIFPDRGSTSGANETRPLKERLFGANKGAALSEQVLPKNYHSRNDVGDPSNWVAMKRGTQAAGNAVSYGSNTYRYLEEGRLGWWESREKEAVSIFLLHGR